TITLSAESTQTVTVNYATAPGLTNPATAGSDYTAIPTTSLTFDPGQTSKQVTVTVNGDTTLERDETLLLKLTSPVNATFGVATGVGTILNDEPPPNTTILDGPELLTRNTSPKFTFSGTNGGPNGLHFEAALDGGAFAPVTGTTLTLNRLAVGTH